MMKLTGLHFLLTYQCTFECDHCFVWGSPSQTGVFSLDNLRAALLQAQELGTIESIYFEGGEPFLFYPILVEGVSLAAGLGFEVGIVTNAYWATDIEDAALWLAPLAGKLSDLSVSSDLFHYDELLSQQAQAASAAARKLGIGNSILSVTRPQDCSPNEPESVMYRGRAAQKLAPSALQKDWETYNICPHEDLREPGRVHIDPFGNLHLCQGLCLGSIYQTPLKKIVNRYIPEGHPIVAPLLAGGPAELVRRYDLPHRDQYADACELCYTTRQDLRARFPQILGPNQMYGMQ